MTNTNIKVIETSFKFETDYIYIKVSLIMKRNTIYYSVNFCVLSIIQSNQELILNRIFLFQELSDRPHRLKISLAFHMQIFDSILLLFFYARTKEGFDKGISNSPRSILTTCLCLDYNNIFLLKATHI